MGQLTLDKFAIRIAKLPAAIFSGLMKLAFGYTDASDKDQDSITKAKRKPSIMEEGLLGMFLNLLKSSGKFFTDVVANHKNLIAATFWGSLLLSGALVIALLLWPAALTAITSFSIYGLSIAVLVGTNALLQIAFAAGITFALTSAMSYLTAGLSQSILYVININQAPPKITVVKSEEKASQTSKNRHALNVVLQVVTIPATIFSGLMNLIFGSSVANTPNAKLTDAQPPSLIKEGLLGNIINGLKFAGKASADFISNHKNAIAAAFWSSLFVSCGLIITLSLWPAALAFIAGVSVYGFSIAGFVGANPLLQILCSASLSFALTSVVSYVIAGISNAIIAIKEQSQPKILSESNLQEEFQGSGVAMSALNSSKTSLSLSIEDPAPSEEAYRNPLQPKSPRTEDLKENPQTSIPHTHPIKR